ncbi:hypothetical protein Syun_012253 [Stephania yunnanensis]|uniref:Uncharacterized protein n=1 Tax=Stephania yunnanensis TaxID=152371 RepID=A0AAP0PF51_9MAGN
MDTLMFSSVIPVGIWPNLVNLVQLDLSSNQFNRRNPNDIGELKSLSGTLKLSYNRFSGEIPRSLENLSVEVSFDLRNNNLSGEILQIGTFVNQGPTSFLGNSSLYGFSLQKSYRNSPQNSPGSSGVKRESRDNSKKGLKSTLIMLISLADAAGVALIGLIIVSIYWKKKDSKSCSCTGRSKFVRIIKKNVSFVLIRVDSPIVIPKTSRRKWGREGRERGIWLHWTSGETPTRQRRPSRRGRRRRRRQGRGSGQGKKMSTWWGAPSLNVG